MSASMRAKLVVTNVTPMRVANPKTGTEETTQEGVSFTAVSASSYPEDGSDENNTYAKFTPQAEFKITICNPALFGKYVEGEQYYVDFTPCDTEAAGDEEAE